MKKTILTFGLISAAVSSIMMLITLPFADRIGFDKGMIVGYTTIVLALLLVFFGIRSYRDNVGKGQITFGKGFLIGLGITLIMCAGYVATWEVLYFNFMPDFMDKYSAYTVQKMQAANATPEAVQAQVEKMKEYKAMYDNPFMNVAMTFIEPFPIGLLVTLISAAALRRKAPPNAAAAAVAVSS